MKIMFVCHGNICRSPMAQYVLEDMLKKRNITGVTVASCATSTEEIGNPVYPPAAAELRAHGIPCPPRRAVRLTQADYEQYDLLLAMDGRNVANMLRLLGADRQNKIKLLLSYTPNPRDVADPWYSGDFAACYDDIEQGCRCLLDKLEKEL